MSIHPISQYGSAADRPVSVLVTGGAGFIGTHLCRALVGAGHSVSVLDLVQPAVAVPGVKYQIGDVSQVNDLNRALEGPIEAVFHLAAVASVLLCEQDLVRSYQTNLLGTALLLDGVRKLTQPDSKKKQDRGRQIRVVFSGSAAVYGNLGSNGKALDESLEVPVPLSNYGIQKLVAEKLFRSFHLNAGIPTVVFRFFNVYGEGQDPTSPYTGVISTFNARVENQKPIELHGGGAQTRDFICVQDVVSACLKVLQLPVESCDGVPMNLASGSRVTIRELAETILKITGSDTPLYVTELRSGDVPHSLGNIERARQVLGWEPQVKLEDGLRSLLKSGAQS